MNRWIWAALVAVFLVALVSVLVGPSEDRMPRQEEGPVVISELRRAPAAQLEPVKEGSERPAERPQPPVTMTPQAPAPKVGDPEGTPQKPPTIDDLPGPRSMYLPERSAMLDPFKKAYSNDSTDSAAAKVEREVREILASVQVPDDMVQAVSCHRRVCRLRLVWSEADPTKMMAAHMGLGTQFNSFIQTDPLGEIDDQGQQTVDVYVLRRGLVMEDIQ